MGKFSILLFFSALSATFLSIAKTSSEPSVTSGQNELDTTTALQMTEADIEEEIVELQTDNKGYFDDSFYAELSIIGEYIKCHSDSNAEKIRFSRVVDTGSGGGLPRGVRLSNSEKSARMDFSWLHVIDWLDRHGAYRCGYEAEEGSTYAVVPYQNVVLDFPDPSEMASVGDNVTLRLDSSNLSRIILWSHNGRRVPILDGRSEVTLFNTNLEDAGIYSARYEGQTDDGAVGSLSVRRCKANVFGERCDQVCPPCYNGGICHDLLGICVCPAGFVGRNCETPCSEGFLGADCSTACKDGNCFFRLFCKPDPLGCSCAPGFKGSWCMTECEPGWYGASCRQPCHCTEDGNCNRYTGACSEGCAPGWKGLSCQIKGFIDDIIDPSINRMRLCRDLDLLQRKKKDSPWKKHANMAL